MVFDVCTFNKISPVKVLTARKDTVTISLRYAVLVPTPKVLAPAPPVSILVSNPMTPPSRMIPANSRGANPVSSSPYCSLVVLTICLSLVKWSIPTRSTTLNQLPSPAVFSASINIVAAPCVTAVLNIATSPFCFLCPVWSLKEYTATTGCFSGAGNFNNSS